MKMPKIRGCTVEDCAYNDHDKCHAMGINVGGPMPCCDTFVDSPGKAGVMTAAAGVGACKVADCRHNKLLSCTADGVNISRRSCMAECVTFKKM